MTKKICFKIKSDTELPPDQVQVPDFKRANYEGLRKCLAQVSQIRG